jgi:hypothetical protein
VGTISEAYPHLIFDQFSSKLGQRVSNILKYLFPVGGARLLPAADVCLPGSGQQGGGGVAAAGHCSGLLGGGRAAGRRPPEPLLLADWPPLASTAHRPPPATRRSATPPPHTLQVPKDDSKRVVTFSNANDYIAFRHHTYSKPAGTKSITLTECGPR